MPDPSTSLRASQDPAGSSRVCPSCGRRVPRNVGICRCGKPVPVVEDAQPAEHRGSSPAVAVLVPLIVTIAVGTGWYYFRPPAEPDVAPRHSIGPPPPDLGFVDPLAAPAAPSKAPTKAPDAAPAAAPAPVDSSKPDAIEDMVARVTPAVVHIETTGPRGSGFFIAYDTLITNAHVVNQDKYVTIKSADGRTSTARVERVAPNFDLALLKVAQPSVSQPFIAIATARALRSGQQVVAIGAPLGLPNTVTRGVVSGLRTAGGATLVQNDAATNPGNSGGPLIDAQGRAIGVNTMSYTDKPGISFAVAIDHVSELVAGRLDERGTAKPGLDDVQAQGQLSESDRQKQRGERDFQSRLDQLTKLAQQIDANWKAYRDECYRSPIRGSYQRDWFAMLAPAGMPADAGAGCDEYYRSLNRQARQFRDHVRTMIVEARRSDMLPGTIRDRLRQNRLDFDWER